MLPVQFGRDICGSLSKAIEREWLVTHGIGGFAPGTVVGLATRRYHALLIAALKPPLGRTLLVSKLEEIARYADLRTLKCCGERREQNTRIVEGRSCFKAPEGLD
jgi:Glycogen debranching enzyme N terminal